MIAHYLTCETPKCPPQLLKGPCGGEQCRESAPSEIVSVLSFLGPAVLFIARLNERLAPSRPTSDPTPLTLVQWLLGALVPGFSPCVQ